jgi:hypothetical protein
MFLLKFFLLYIFFYIYNINIHYNLNNNIILSFIFLSYIILDINYHTISKSIISEYSVIKNINNTYLKPDI